MVQFAVLLSVFAAVANPIASQGLAQQSQSVEPRQSSSNTDLLDDDAIQNVRDLKVNSSEKAVKDRVVGRLIWRTKQGDLRLQFHKGYKAYQLQGDTSQLSEYSIGDLIEVSGLGVSSPLTVATKIRRIKPWDGTKLYCEPAIQNKARKLWRYVEHTAVIHEILEADGCCRFFMGKKVIVEVATQMPKKQLASLLGTRVRVCGSSYRHLEPRNTETADFLYIGVLDPNLQIQMTKQQPNQLPTPETWLSLHNATIDRVTQREVALNGQSFLTEMSHHIKPGDLVDLKGLRLDGRTHNGRAIWLKKNDRKKRALASTIHEQEDEIRNADQPAAGAVVSAMKVVHSPSKNTDQNASSDVGNANDLVITNTPTMFRIGLVKAIVAGVLFTVLLSGFWYWALKRQVKRKTKEISISMNRMVAASSAVRHGLLIFDAASRVRFVSDKVRFTLGIELPIGHSESITRQRLHSLIRDPNSFIDRWNDVFRNPHNTYEGSFSLCRTDRQVFAFSAPIYNSNGQLDGRIWTFEDITERRKFENETLQTSKLAAIGRLAGGVAHDFNNLLQVIGSNLELIRYSTAEELQLTQESCLEPALAAVRRGADLSRQLLTFAKTSRVEVVPTDVNQRLKQTVRMLDRTLGDNIRLSVSLTRGIPRAEVDSAQLEQAVMNMCLNSSEAIGSNDGYIKVTTKKIEHGQIGQSIVIEIEDDGCGMSPEVLSHVFEPFFTTKDIDKGTGLGLATAFGAVEQMKGRIECSSTVGEGTCFRIYLPVSIDSTCLPTAPTANANMAMPRRILLVDDDPRILASVRQLLKCLGHDVICAGGGAEAIAKLETESVDLVILDLSMPEMTGWQVLQTIREVHGDLKVIVCSGYSDDASQMMTSNVEPDAFLNKPFQKEQLSVALEAVSK